MTMSKVFEIQDPSDFYFKLIEVLYSRIENSGSQSWDCLNAGEKAAIAIWELDGEVNNGGFDQYFFNSSGDHALEAVPALKLVGAVKTEALVRKALTAFPHGVPSEDRDIRCEQLDRIEVGVPALWRDLEDEYYAEPEDLTELVFAYCHQRRSDFGA